MSVIVPKIEPVPITVTLPSEREFGTIPPIVASADYQMALRIRVGRKQLPESVCKRQPNMNAYLFCYRIFQ